jgi:hypothetical protein
MLGELVQVATEIARAHAAATEAASSALEHGRRAGELLIQAKAALPHGAWLPWLTEHCPMISERTARAYMAVARRWPAIEAERDRQRVADLPLRQALAFLAEPRPAVLPASSPDEWTDRFRTSRETIEHAVRQYLETERDFVHWHDAGGPDAPSADVAELHVLRRAVDVPGLTVDDLLALSTRGSEIFTAAMQWRLASTEDPELQAMARQALQQEAE